MWGRIIQCERGYKAQYAQIQEPLVLDLTCVAGCDQPPVRVGLPNHPQMVFSAFCYEHARTAEHSVLIENTIWLRDVKDGLSRRYGLEFLSWT